MGFGRARPSAREDVHLAVVGPDVHAVVAGRERGDRAEVRAEDDRGCRGRWRTTRAPSWRISASLAGSHAAQLQGPRGEAGMGSG